MSTSPGTPGPFAPLDAPAAPDAPMPPPASRLASIDAYRGLVMLLMMAEVLRLRAVAANRPGSAIWALLCHHQEHVEWVGCVLHDLIQPSFSFLVGVALPFSIAARRAKGQSPGRMTVHAAWRALVLVALGVFLRSIGRERTYFTFEDTLSQIGLGYLFLFLLGFRPARDQVIALALILVGYGAAFALYPLPGPGFDYPAVGVPADWPHHLDGFAAHWNKNSNAAWAFDVWFLNLFPREKPFAYNGGGYATLSFIPTLGTMILGLLAGTLLKSTRSHASKLGILIVAGAGCLAAGWALGYFGVCPVVKRIWTPSWALYSGGFCFLFLAGFYLLTDVTGYAGWSYPLRVVGRNSIAAYVIAGTLEGFIGGSLTTHLGTSPFLAFGADFEPLAHGAAVLLVMWLILFWMDRRRIYLRI
jgi:predicted acyltransferase